MVVRIDGFEGAAVVAGGFSPEVAAATAELYETKLKKFVSAEEWPHMAPLIYRINQLKKERGAVVLAHNYMTPEIYHGIADFVGDSLALARKATETDAQVIVQCGVHFMAETSKILNPAKTVLMPDMRAGCSLASSITAADIRLLRQKYPGVPVVTYVNTSAEVKAESDICCTSANAVKVVESLGADRVLCLPDEYLAQWVANQTKVKILTWKGHCEVHERFTGAELDALRTRYGSELVIIAHPECPPDVLNAADFVGSTSEMIGYAKRERPAKVLMVTECSMSDNVAAELPDVDFIRPCHLCPHMKRITLDKVLHALETMGPEVTVDPAIAAKAKRAVDNMLALNDQLARNKTVSKVA